MVSFSGLSAVYPGELAAQGQSQQNDLRGLQIQEARGIQQGQADFAKGLMQALVPGAQAMPPQAPPQMAPQAPPPGQPSQPMRPPQPPPVAPPGPAAGGARGPQPGMPVGAPPGGAQQSGPPGGPPGGGAPPPGQGLPPQAQQLAGRVDLRSATQGILKANPGIQQDPQRLYYALKAGEWILNDQAKQQLADMRQQMQQQNLDLRRDIEDERERHNRETEDRLRDAEKAKQDRFNTREARLEAQNQIKNDQSVARLALQQKGLEYKIANGERIFNAKREDVTMKTWRDIADAKRKAALAAASIYSVNNGLDDKQKAKLLKDVNDSAEEEIANMRNLQGSSTPTGGTPKADGTKTSERAGDQPKPLSTDIRKQFDDALAAGKPKEALIKRLQEQGYTTEGL